jgi:hypothetical protein
MDASRISACSTPAVHVDSDLKITNQSQVRPILLGHISNIPPALAPRMDNLTLVIRLECFDDLNATTSSRESRNCTIVVKNSLNLVRIAIKDLPESRLGPMADL